MQLQPRSQPASHYHPGSEYQNKDVLGRGKAQAYDDFFIELFSSLAEFFLCGLVDGSGSSKHHLKCSTCQS